MHFEDKAKNQLGDALLEKDQMVSLRSPRNDGTFMNQSYEPMSFLNASKLKQEDSDDNYSDEEEVTFRDGNWSERYAGFSCRFPCHLTQNQARSYGKKIAKVVLPEMLKSMLASLNNENKRISEDMSEIGSPISRKEEAPLPDISPKNSEGNHEEAEATEAAVDALNKVTPEEGESHHSSQEDISARENRLRNLSDLQKKSVNQREGAAMREQDSLLKSVLSVRDSAKKLSQPGNWSSSEDPSWIYTRLADIISSYILKEKETLVVEIKDGESSNERAEDVINQVSLAIMQRNLRTIDIIKRLLDDERGKDMDILRKRLNTYLYKSLVERQISIVDTQCPSIIDMAKWIVANQYSKPDELLVNEFIEQIETNGTSIEDPNSELRNVNLETLQFLKASMREQQQNEETYRQNTNNWVRAKKNFVEILWNPKENEDPEESFIENAPEEKYVVLDKEFYFNTVNYRGNLVLQLSKFKHDVIKHEKTIVLNWDFPFVPEENELFQVPYQMMSSSFVSYLQDRDQLIYFEIDREQKSEKEEKKEEARPSRKTWTEQTNSIFETEPKTPSKQMDTPQSNVKDEKKEEAKVPMLNLKSMVQKIANKYNYSYKLKLLSQSLGNLYEEPLLYESFSAPVIHHEITREEMSPIAAMFISQQMHSDGSLVADSNPFWTDDDGQKENTRKFIDSQFVAILYRAQKKSNKFRISIRKIGNLYKELFISSPIEDELFDMAQDFQTFRVKRSQLNELKLNREAPKDSIVIMSGGELKYQLAIEFDECGQTCLRDTEVFTGISVLNREREELNSAMRKKAGGLFDYSSSSMSAVNQQRGTLQTWRSPTIHHNLNRIFQKLEGNSEETVYNFTALHNQSTDELYLLYTQKPRSICASWQEAERLEQLPSVGQSKIVRLELKKKYGSNRALKVTDYIRMNPGIDLLDPKSQPDMADFNELLSSPLGLILSQAPEGMIRSLTQSNKPYTAPVVVSKAFKNLAFDLESAYIVRESELHNGKFVEIQGDDQILEVQQLHFDSADPFQSRTRQTRPFVFQSDQKITCFIGPESTTPFYLGYNLTEADKGNMPFDLKTTADHQAALPYVSIKQRPFVIFNKLQFLEDSRPEMVVVAKDNYTTNNKLWLLVINTRKGTILASKQITIDKDEREHLEGVAISQASDPYTLQEQFTSSFFTKNQNMPKVTSQNFHVALNYAKLGRVKIIDYRVKFGGFVDVQVLGAKELFGKTGVELFNQELILLPKYEKKHRINGSMFVYVGRGELGEQELNLVPIENFHQLSDMVEKSDQLKKEIRVHQARDEFTSFGYVKYMDSKFNLKFILADVRFQPELIKWQKEFTRQEIDRVLDFYAKRVLNMTLGSLNDFIRTDLTSNQAFFLPHTKLKGLSFCDFRLGSPQDVQSRLTQLQQLQEQDNTNTLMAQILEVNQMDPTNLEQEKRIDLLRQHKFYQFGSQVDLLQQQECRIQKCILSNILPEHSHFSSMKATNFEMSITRENLLEQKVSRVHDQKNMIFESLTSSKSNDIAIQRGGKVTLDLRDQVLKSKLELFSKFIVTKDESIAKSLKTRTQIDGLYLASKAYEKILTIHEQKQLEQSTVLLSMIQHQYKSTFRFQAILAFMYLFGYVCPLVYLVQYHSDRSFLFVAMSFLTATIIFVVDVIKLTIYAQKDWQIVRLFSLIGYFMFLFLLTEKIIFKITMASDATEKEKKSTHIIIDNMVQIQGTFLLMQALSKFFNLLSTYEKVRMFNCLVYRVGKDITPTILMYAAIITTMSFIIRILELQTNDQDQLDNPEIARQGIVSQIIEIFQSSLRLHFMEVPLMEKLEYPSSEPLSSLHKTQTALLFIMWIMAQIMIPIMFLNILIAIVNNTYANVKGQKEYQKFMDMAQLNFDTRYIFRVFGRVKPIDKYEFTILERTPELVGGFQAVDDGVHNKADKQEPGSGDVWELQEQLEENKIMMKEMQERIAKFEQNQQMKTEGVLRQVNEIKQMMQFLYFEKRIKVYKQEQDRKEEEAKLRQRENEGVWMNLGAMLSQRRSTRK